VVWGGWRNRGGESARRARIARPQNKAIQCAGQGGFLGRGEGAFLLLWLLQTIIVIPIEMQRSPSPSTFHLPPNLPSPAPSSRSPVAFVELLSKLYTLQQ